MVNLHNFRKRGQPLEVYPNFRTYFPGNFRSIWFSSWNFQNFRLNGSLFGKFNNFRISWDLSLEISVPFVSVSKISEILVEWKAPMDTVKSGKLKHTLFYHQWVWPTTSIKRHCQATWSGKVSTQAHQVTNSSPSRVCSRALHLTWSALTKMA